MMVIFSQYLKGVSRYNLILSVNYAYACKKIRKGNKYYWSNTELWFSESKSVLGRCGGLHTNVWTPCRPVQLIWVEKIEWMLLRILLYSKKRPVTSLSPGSRTGSKGIDITARHSNSKSYYEPRRDEKKRSRLNQRDLSPLYTALSEHIRGIMYVTGAWVP